MAIIDLKNSQIGRKWAEIFLAISCPSVLWGPKEEKGRVAVGQSRSAGGRAAECFLSLSVNKEPAGHIALSTPLIGIIPAPPVTDARARGGIWEVSEGGREGGKAGLVTIPSHHLFRGHRESSSYSD